MAFRPSTTTTITITHQEYRFSEHPSARGMPYGQTGRRATVYQIQDDNGKTHAMKVFTKAFRSEQYERSVSQLEAFSDFPGLQVCRRRILTRQTDNALITQNPDLEYSIIMPWVQGQTWQEMMLSKQPLSETTSKVIAGGVASVLAIMEQNGLSHCDLSGPNVLLPGLEVERPHEIALVDVEDMFGPGLIQPEKLPSGSAGYGHKSGSNGFWSADADRFAGAILIAEMLGWCDERARRIAYGEQFFAPDELQTNNERYRILLQVLTTNFGDKIADLFSQAWFSGTLSLCPTFAEWEQILVGDELGFDVKPSDSIRTNLPTFKPDYVPLEINGVGESASAETPIKPAPEKSADSEVFNTTGTDTDDPMKGSTNVVWGLTAVFAIATIILLFMLVSAKHETSSWRADYWDAQNKISSLEDDIAIQEETILGNQDTISEMEDTIFSLEDDISYLQELTDNQTTAISILMPNPNEELIFGPKNGVLDHEEDEYIEGYYAREEKSNFIAIARFQNPYAASEHSWDYGFLFRQSGKNKLVIRIKSSGYWALDWTDADGWHDISNGYINNINDGASDTNELLLIAKGSKGYFFVNGNYVANLNLSKITSEGDIAVATGTYSGNEVNGKSTKFLDFTIWSLP